MEVAKAKVDQQTRSRYHARESMELVSSAGNMEPASEPALSGKKRHRRDALENMEP